jgi:HlyD family secretion protein
MIGFSSGQPQRSGRVTTAGLIGLTVVALGGALLVPSVRQSVFSVLSSQQSGDTGRYILHPVVSGPFRIEITEDGKIDSVRNSTLSSSVQGSTTIIFLVSEGSMVQAPTVAEFSGNVEVLDSPSSSIQPIRLIGDEEGQQAEFDIALGGFAQLLVEDGQRVTAGEYLAGDVVCELDSSTLVESAMTQQIKVTGALADLEKADTDLKIQMTTNEKFLKAAELAEALAKLDLTTYTSQGGQYEQDLETILAGIKKIEEELAMAQEAYDRERELARKGYTSLYNLEAKRVAVTQQKIMLSVDKGKLVVLERFTKERTEKELAQLAEDTKRDIERARLEGQAAMSQMAAALKAAKLTLALEQETLSRQQRQIADCRLVAPQAGEVVYASQASRRSEPVVIELGASVRERQAIVKLPNLDQMKVEARIHESRIRQVKAGQLVEISVSSLPGLNFHGVLETVASLPVPGEWPNNNQMEFESTVTITDPPEMVAQLKPGMGTELRIIVEERNESVLQIPVQSVLPIAGSFFAYVQTKQGPERRPLAVGTSNDEFMEILDGVATGENVILNPRTHFSQEINQLEQDLTKDAGASSAEAQDTIRPGQRPDVQLSS